MTTVSRILYYSEIHIEIRVQKGRPGWTDVQPLALGPDLTGLAGTADLLVLAGDIDRMRLRRDVSTLYYAEQAAVYLGCPAIVVPGNHEYYRGSFEDERDALLAARAAAVTVLDRREARYPYGPASLRVLGATRRRTVPAAGRGRRASAVARIAGGAARRADAGGDAPRALFRHSQSGFLGRLPSRPRSTATVAI